VGHRRDCPKELAESHAEILVGPEPVTALHWVAFVHSACHWRSSMGSGRWVGISRWRWSVCE